MIKSVAMLSEVRRVKRQRSIPLFEVCPAAVSRSSTQPVLARPDLYKHAEP
jgi:hypothetical protein